MSPDDRAPTAAAPFDDVAESYDATFTDTLLGRWLRGQVHHFLERAFPPGRAVLELGCGTGEDAAWMASLGVRVTATDRSGAMLREAAAKAERRGVGDRVTPTCWDLDDPDPAVLPLPDGGRFDGAYSDFGPINCVADRPALAAALADLLTPGAPLLLVAMGPFCLMETLAFALGGRKEDALRRRRPDPAATIGDRTLPVWYPSPRRLRDDFAPFFAPRRCVGIGTLLPPSLMAATVERHAALLRPLAAIDPWLGRTIGRWIADHYLLWLERRRAPG